MDIPPDISAASPAVQAHYLRMIADGQTPRFAEMLALQQPPGTKGTDRTFMQGRYGGEWLNEMPPHQATRIVSEARAAGISIEGKYYHSGLADRRGHADPEAWVDGLDDIKRVAAKRNLNVEGAVTVKAQEVEPSPKKLDKKIEKQLVQHYMANNKRMSVADAKAVVADKHVPAWKKK